MIDDVIDKAWESLLAGVLKKRSVARPGIGDEIDLYVPQARLLSLLQDDAGIPRLLYTSARKSARRNAGTIVGKLGMPADYFWKFEYWPKARAFTTLEKIVSRVFSSIMKQAKEGELKIVELNIDPLVIDITFNNCVECAGITGPEHGICYYHAGTFSGILSGLINRDLECYETECHAAGGSQCKFTVFDSVEGGPNPDYEAYLSPPPAGADVISRLRDALEKSTVRELGNLVDISYLQLAVANTLLADPDTYAPVSYEIGSKLGRKLAPVLADYYGSRDLSSLREYYLQLGEFSVEITGDSSQVNLLVKECAEISGTEKLTEMTSFLTGELKGILSEFFKKNMKPGEWRFEGDNLLLTFVPEE
jgi:predicted hydrocarbon binding protein